MPTVTVQRNELSVLYANTTAKAGKERPLWMALSGYYHVCIPSAVSNFSRFVWRLFNLTGGFKNETYESICRMPPKIVEALEVVKGEVSRIDGVRARDDKRRQEAIITAAQHEQGRGYGK